MNRPKQRNGRADEITVELSELAAGERQVGHLTAKLDQSATI
jgi:hypothetical protein